MIEEFYQLPHALFACALTPTDFFLYLLLVKLDTQHQKPLTLAIESIARQAKLHRNTVAPSLKRLAGKKLITVHVNTTNGILSSSTYTLLLEGPFTQIPSKIFELALSSQQFLVYSFLLMTANGSPSAVISVRKLAKCLHICPNTIYAAIHGLIAKGILQKNKQIEPSGAAGCSEYRLLLR